MIQKLNLTNFRNFDKKTIEFGEGVNIINAPNASGKTNILEAIFMLSLGKSFKTRKVDECIKYGEQISRISTEGLEVVLTKEVDGWPKKRLIVNGVPRRLVDFAGSIKTVLFAPQDLELVTDGPTLRRNFLDNVLCVVDKEYRRSLLSYEKGIRQRNRLLLQIRDNGVSRNSLVFWNQLLIKNGDFISNSRRNLIEFINSLGNCNLEYDPSSISESRLEQYNDAEVASAMTLVGPHRDDFKFLKDGRDVASFGSRGQQRMEVLYLKIAEMNFIEAKTGVKPILLLDDIFSELDHSHREIVMQTLNSHQVIITSADPHNIENIKNQMLKIKMINL